MTIVERLLSIFRGPRAANAPPSLTPQQLQHLYTSAHRSYRELLNANNNALEAMAALEQALMQARTLSMVFIRAKCTLVTVNVYKIIRHLNTLAEGRYAGLEGVFSHLNEQIDQILNGKHPPPAGELVIPLARIGRAHADLAGEKMANLGEVGTLDGIAIPPGFALTSAATRLFFEENALYPAINHILQKLDITDLKDLHAKSASLQYLILQSPLPKAIEEQLFAQFDLLAASQPDLRVAMRSSALGEDLGQASFAGLYHTELNVRRGQMVAAYKSVLASKYSPRAISYRLAKGFRHEETEMCVGCLAMIDAQVSGICYSRSLSGSGAVDLFFAAGSAKGIVDGTRPTVHYLIERTPPYRIARRQPVDSPADAALADATASALAAIALRLEQHFGAPQDIEWSVDQTGAIAILQSRPLSVAPPAHLPKAATAAASGRVLIQGGVTGCWGAGCGPVHHVHTSADMLTFPKRAVLVVKHPLPEWAPLLKRAAALVAETGSEAGHLATISREYGLPSLLALGQATGQLKQGEIVTVDATNRVVYDGHIDAVLQAEAQPLPNLMRDSPVQRVLTEVLALISPLHLTNPGSPDFRAANCQTMHDITRFCHERAVVEMFSFGGRYHFAAGTAKRLIDPLPLEWWVIDLKDGFTGECDPAASEVSSRDIASQPMLALLRGMRAVAWDGPPAVRLRTMFSFLAHSAVRIGLNPDLSSSLTEKNYFLISQKYCNLSVRLGYHYAMIEAQVGDRPPERYITFRFKGGAALADNRVRRIELLADILAKYDFRIDLVGEALTARVERLASAEILKRLTILGYLTIHTRQLDMAMTSSGEMQYFINKFIHDIERMLNDDQ